MAGKVNNQLHPELGKTGFCLCLLVTLSPCHLVTLSPSEVAECAVSAFQEGVRLRQAADQARPHFRAAAASFDELRRRGVHNPALYRNLGNASLLAGDLPRAILSYHRGLRLAPNDLALREGLAEARERVVYPASGSLGRPLSDPRPPWLPQPRTEWLLTASALCYTLAWTWATRWLMVRRGRLLAGGMVALLLAGLLSVWLLTLTREERDRDEHPLVVIARDGVRLRRGNGMVFPARYDTPIPRGVEARLRFERGGWVRIELSGGEIGWVPRDAVLVDSP